MNEYYIINEIDRPDADHVVQKINDRGECCYISERLKKWATLQLRDNSTNMKDFGFDIDEIIKSGIKVTMFTKQRASKATYRDGEIRQWQGEPVFTLKQASGENS